MILHISRMRRNVNRNVYNNRKNVSVTQQTMTHDFTCSVGEFTSSTGSIHVNSLDSVNKFGVSTCVYREIMSFSHDDTCQWNCTSSDPVRLVSNSFKTHDSRQNTCIHVNTVNTHENTYWWSGTNYEPVWHMPTGSEMVPCLLGLHIKNMIIPWLLRINCHINCLIQDTSTSQCLVSGMCLLLFLI